MKTASWIIVNKTTRAVRVISAAKFTEENRAANHAAMRAVA